MYIYIIVCLATLLTETSWRANYVPLYYAHTLLSGIGYGDRPEVPNTVVSLTDGIDSSLADVEVRTHPHTYVKNVQ